MNIMSGISVYVMIWVIVLFMVLPVAVRVPDHVETGHATSAPENPYMGWKILATSVISLVLWFGAYYLITSDWLSFR